MRIVWGIILVSFLVYNRVINKIIEWIIFDKGVFLLVWMLIIVCMVVFVFGNLLNNLEIIFLIFWLINLWLELWLVWVMLFVIKEVSSELIVFRVFSIKLFISIVFSCLKVNIGNCGLGNLVGIFLISMRLLFGSKNIEIRVFISNVSSGDGIIVFILCGVRKRIISVIIFSVVVIGLRLVKKYGILWIDLIILVDLGWLRNGLIWMKIIIILILDINFEIMV